MKSDGLIDVLGLGAVTVDFVGTVHAWPGKGVKTMLDSFAVCDGGLVGTALVASARLGGTVAFAGKLGQSEMARRALDSLRRESIDTSFVIETPDAEPIVAFIRRQLGRAEVDPAWAGQVLRRGGRQCRS